MDYLIADAVVIPPAAEQFYEEQVVRLPASFMSRDPTLPSPPTPSRSQAGLPEQDFVFCCFNNSYKFNPPVFDVWMRLLKALPGSVLWLLSPGKEARENLEREAGARGISPQRIVFAERVPATDHLARTSLADLFLDTLPYNAHTTTSDALWAGVPVLTCTGEAFASRVAASLLTAAGLPELITYDLAHYEALALRLAKTPGLLAELRARLVRGRAEENLFPVDRLRANIEAAYSHMHERSSQGLPPQGFNV
jgi:predicted O-linked N-acetylglucosamine transferase (SPINDLY family)